MSWQAEMLGIDIEALKRERFHTYVAPKRPEPTVVEQPAESRWITLKEAAELVHYHVATIRRWTESGQIAYVMQKNRLMVAKDDILRHAGTR